MKIFSTFTGIGGFEVGIQNAYGSTIGRSKSNTQKSSGFWQRLLASARKSISTKKRSISPGNNNFLDERPLFVGYSEIDKYATSIYEKQFKGVKNYGDITKINADELPDFDCLVGGFPCQAFSIAGKRGGFEDTRGTLFFDLARILRAKQPRLFVFENVKGLLSHDSGATFRTIINTIAELGYDAEWQVVNSKDYNVPQNRERIIIVGHLRGTPTTQVFPLEGSNGNYIKEITRAVPQAQRVYEKSGIAPSVDTGQGGNRQAKIIQRSRGKNNGGVKDIAPTLTGRSYQDNNHLMQEFSLRRLTPIECERLQAFPDNWTAIGKHDEIMSDTQRYKMCGNAVTTNVVQAVFERIFSHL